jgi:predicted amidophosphoribosyltransferase
MKCGKKLPKECIHCGAELPENALFCIKCGKKLTHNGPLVDDAQKEIGRWTPSTGQPDWSDKLQAGSF